MRIGLVALVAAGFAVGAAAYAQDKKIDAISVDEVMKNSWKSASPEWQERLLQDQTMKECTESRNEPNRTQPTMCSSGSPASRRRTRRSTSVSSAASSSRIAASSSANTHPAARSRAAIEARRSVTLWSLGDSNS